MDDATQISVAWNNGNQYELTEPGDSGTLTVPDVDDIPPTGSTLIIVRRVNLTQLTNYVENDPFPAESHENALDKLTMAVQELDADVSGDTLVLPGQVTVKNNGVIITTAVQVLNFINFNITEPIDDEVDIAIGVANANGTYNPGYASYTFVSTNEFTVDLVNAVSLFYVGRRIRFTSNLGAFTFGLIAARDFDSTQANDTYILMTMDGIEEVPAIISTVDLVSSDTQWTPISEDPFEGESINDICIGDILGVTYLLAVGDLGKAGFSLNGGLTWSMLTTYTIENLNCCVFDSVHETFWIGGNAGVLVKSIDGLAFIIDDTSVPALTGVSTDDINGIAYNSGEDALGFMYHYTTAWRAVYSTDQGVTWTEDGILGIPPVNSKILKSLVNVGGATGPSNYTLLNANTISRVRGSMLSSSWSTGDSMSPTIPTSMGFFDDGGLSVRMYGGTNGNVIGKTGWGGFDDATFMHPIRDFAYSILHQRLVIVGDFQQLGYWNEVDKAAADAIIISESGFDPLANILGVEWDYNSGNFCAVASTGQICRSSNGSN